MAAFNRDDSFEAGKVAAWRMELPSGKLQFDDIKAEQLGYDPKDFNHYEHFTSLIHPDDYEPAMQSMRDYLDGKTQIYRSKYRIKASDGEYHIYLDTGIRIEPVADDTIKHIIIGATVDLT